MTRLQDEGIRVGDHVIAFESIWLVDGVECTTVRLVGVGSGIERSVSVHELVWDASYRVINADEEDPFSEVLASAGALAVEHDVAARAVELARHIAEVEGRGPFLPGERPADGFVPRAAYRPDRPLGARYKAKVAELEGTHLACSYRQLERHVSAYRRHGVSGLLPQSAFVKQVRRRQADPRFLEVLASQMLAEAAGPERGTDLILTATNKVLAENLEYADVVVPSVSTQKRWLQALMAREGWRYGRRKYVQSRQQRPDRTQLPAGALMPGERIEVDTTTLNVYVWDPVTGRKYRPYVTVALDVATRCVAGLVSSHREDHTTLPRLMLDVMTPKPATNVGSAASYVNRLGVAPDLLFEVYPDLPEDARFADGPLIRPRMVVIDQGKAFYNQQVLWAMERMGIVVELARKRTPTDKSHIERFFRTLESVLVLLAEYAGKDVASLGQARRQRGDALLTRAELETILRAWIALVYHQRRHRGLRLPVSRGEQVELTPMEAYALLVEQHGFIPAPLSPELRYMAMDVARLTIQDDGVQLKGLKYDSPELNHVRMSPCSWTSNGLWHVHFDPMDCRQVYLQVPVDGARRWVEVPWRHQPAAFTYPFPFRVLEFVRTYVPTKSASGPFVTYQERANRLRSRGKSASHEAGEGAADFVTWIRAYVASCENTPDEHRKVMDVMRDMADAMDGTHLERLEERYSPRTNRVIKTSVDDMPTSTERAAGPAGSGRPSNAMTAELSMSDAWLELNGVPERSVERE